MLKNSMRIRNSGRVTPGCFILSKKPPKCCGLPVRNLGSKTFSFWGKGKSIPCTSDQHRQLHSEKHFLNSEGSITAHRCNRSASLPSLLRKRLNISRSLLIAMLHRLQRTGPWPTGKECHLCMYYRIFHELILQAKSTDVKSHRSGFISHKDTTSYFCFRHVWNPAV